MKIFICHSTQDHDFVIELAKRLKSDSFEVFIDDWSINLGESITEKVNEGLSQSSIFIIVLSENSLDSDWVKRELSATVMRQVSQKDIVIVPLLLEIDFTEIPPLIRDLKGIRFMSRTVNNSIYRELINGLRNSQKLAEQIKYEESYFKDIEIIDLIIKRRHPTRQDIKIINDYLSKAEYQNYFFNNATSVNLFHILKLEGFFDADKAPSPEEDKDQEGYFSMPTWNVLPYLERVSEQVNESGNEQYVDELLAIIRNITAERVKQKVENKLALDNYRTWWFFTKILINLPNDKIPIDILESISVWVDSTFGSTLPGVDLAMKLLPKFLDSEKPEDWIKAEKIIEVITDIKPKRVSKEEIEAWGIENKWETVLDDYWLKEAFIKGNFAQLVGEKCSSQPIFIISDRLKTIFSKNEKENIDYSYIWMPSLYSDPEHLYDDAKVILTLILRDILLAKSKESKEQANEIINNYLEKYDYPLFKRLVLYIVANNWDDYEKYFWEMLNQALLNSGYYEVEIYELLERNVSEFAPERKAELKQIIEKGPISSADEEKSDEYTAHWKQGWYSALKTDEYFKPLYEELKAVTKTEKVKPKIGVNVERHGYESPLTNEEIVTMSNKELGEFLNEFKSKSGFNEPTIDGLASALRSTVKENPEKFTNDLSPFLGCDYLYVYNMLSGFEDAWNNKKSFSWKNSLQFVKDYIHQPDFWSKDNKARATYEWVTGAIGELIQAGTRSDDWAFEPQYLDMAKKIIFYILDNQKIEMPPEIHDPVTTTLNSPFGKIISALILIALREARLDKQKDKPPSLDPDIKAKYEEALKRNIFEAYVLVGQYMPNLYWMDKEWVEAKAEEFLSADDNSWYAFIEGYLYGVNRFYPQFHKFMKKHYLKALSIDFSKKEDRALDKLIQHITIAYLRNIETIDDKTSLFKKVLDDWKYSQIDEVVGFLWEQKQFLIESEADGEETKKRKAEGLQRIIELWRWIYENKFKSKTKLDKDDKIILSSLSRLAIFLPKLDTENSEWLKLSAPYINENFHTPFLIEYLNDLKDKGESKETGKYIGSIFMEILKFVRPDYKKEHIYSIVEFLYEKGDNKKAADKICNIYDKNQNHFLRHLYDKYNP